MALFRTLSAPEPLQPITGEGVMLRGPQMADYSAWAECARRAASFSPRGSRPGRRRSDAPAFRQRLRRYAEDMRTDQAYPFFLFRTEDNALVGGLALANIRRGVAQAAASATGLARPSSSGAI
jgi:ribosomal-protein-alanine N-acetyltransferase